jgi:hypothetical protein
MKHKKKKKKLTNTLLSRKPMTNQSWYSCSSWRQSKEIQIDKKKKKTGVSLDEETRAGRGGYAR